MSLQQEGGKGSGWGEPGPLCSPYLLVEMLTATLVLSTLQGHSSVW